MDGKTPEFQFTVAMQDGGYGILAPAPQAPTFVPLETLIPMRWMADLVLRSVGHVFEHNRYLDSRHLWRVPLPEAAELRRYLNVSLQDYPYAFYLQRIEWAKNCRRELTDKGLHAGHVKCAVRDPSRHPCTMQRGRGFGLVVHGMRDTDWYSFGDFYLETVHCFQAIRSHLIAVHSLLGLLYANVVTMQFSGFTPSGLREMRQLYTRLRSVLDGLLIATHLQAASESQEDLSHSLVSYDHACTGLVAATSAFFDAHRERIVRPAVWPDSGEGDFLLSKPTTCLPVSAGVIQDYIALVRELAMHSRAIFRWALRLYNTWHEDRPAAGSTGRGGSEMPPVGPGENSEPTTVIPTAPPKDFAPTGGDEGPTASK